MNVHSQVASRALPHSLADARSFIETQFPVGRVSAESYKERKAGAGQTLTGLGSYWKGRKPLLLVRATVLGCLLPATNDPVADLRVFLLLMGMDDASIIRRMDSVTPQDMDPEWSKYPEVVSPGVPARWRADVSRETRRAIVGQWLSTLPYNKRIGFCLRPENIGDDLLAGAWPEVNGHLGTDATCLTELVDQLGMMRFGRRPRVGDTFAGGGSIPFEAARMGCDVAASDLNPIACMLNWASFNLLSEKRSEGVQPADRLSEVEEGLESYFEQLGIETDEGGNRAKSYLYCLEVICPKTGWLVPLSQSWVISTKQNVIARLVPDPANKRYDIEIVTGVTNAEADAARIGTIVGNRLVHPMNPDKEGVALEVVRSNYKADDGTRKNRLRLWDKQDFKPKQYDIFQERLYCIQWITEASIKKRHQVTFFRAPTAGDAAREATVDALVAENLEAWQKAGFVPDMKIEPGNKTDEPIRTRGWTHWHHLFAPRQILLLAKMNSLTGSPQGRVLFANELNFHSKLCTINPRTRGSGREMCLDRVFINQALNTLINYGVRSSAYRADNSERLPSLRLPTVEFTVTSRPASKTEGSFDLFITDPPYADAVNYHEITEYFIAWLRARVPADFEAWNWSSNRSLAIKGDDEQFRSEMVAAYKAMADHMPANGMQVVMFTHQDAGVWADLASIMWAAGLRVTAAWNIVTETESARREGNYVQGTILLVLRKRNCASNIKRMDIEGEIEEAVDHQLAAMHSLDEDWTSERLYTDGDLQLAAYAAALRVITGYATIDRKDVGADVYRRLAKGEKTVIRELIEYAASVANNKLVPDGFPPAMWRDLDAASRFYVRMLDMESKGTTKFADYQDFARTFSVADYADLMDSTKANAAALAGAGALKGKILGGKSFGSSSLRRVLFATYKTMQKDDPREGLAFLRTELGQDYWSNRAKLVALAKYVSAKTVRTRPVESSAADLLAQRLEVDKV